MFATRDAGEGITTFSKDEGWEDGPNPVETSTGETNGLKEFEGLIGMDEREESYRLIDVQRDNLALSMA